MSFSYWFKTYHGISSDPKITTAAKTLEIPKPYIIAAWLYMLECVSSSTVRGTIKNLNPKVFETATEFPADRMQDLLNEFTELNMIRCVQEGEYESIILLNWEKHQSSEPQKSYETQRKASYRRDKADHARILKEMEEIHRSTQEIPDNSNNSEDVELVYDSYIAMHRDGDKQTAMKLITERLKNYSVPDLLKLIKIYYEQRDERNQLNSQYCYVPQNFFKEDKIRGLIRTLRPSERVQYTDKAEVEQFELHHFQKVLSSEERKEMYWQVDLAEEEGKLKFPKLEALAENYELI